MMRKKRREKPASRALSQEPSGTSARIFIGWREHACINPYWITLVSTAYQIGDNQIRESSVKEILFGPISLFVSLFLNM